MKLTNENFEFLKAELGKYLPELQVIHKDFGGPSVYFHQQALIECKRDFLSVRHLEMIYATLASWGMHRMGQTKTKMVEFETFQNSILALSGDLTKLKGIKIEDFSTEPVELFNLVRSLCFQIKVSGSDSKVVGNSKALAHILPNLVPPVDRRYSISFFVELLSNFSGLEEEQLFYGHILTKCYEFSQFLKTQPTIEIDTRFNSSIPKIFDNLLMIYLKRRRVEEKIQDTFSEVESTGSDSNLD